MEREYVIYLNDIEEVEENTSELIIAINNPDGNAFTNPIHAFVQSLNDQINYGMLAISYDKHLGFDQYHKKMMFVREFLPNYKLGDWIFSSLDIKGLSDNYLKVMYHNKPLYIRRDGITKINDKLFSYSYHALEEIEDMRCKKIMYKMLELCKIPK